MWLQASHPSLSFHLCEMPLSGTSLCFGKIKNIIVIYPYHEMICKSIWKELITDIRHNLDGSQEN